MFSAQKIRNAKVSNSMNLHPVVFADDGAAAAGITAKAKG
jgi:hypothetical protein